MKSERRRLIGSLFADAVVCPPAEPSRFLEKARDDDELRKEQDSLLAFDAPDHALRLAMMAARHSVDGMIVPGSIRRINRHGRRSEGIRSRGLAGCGHGN